MSKNSETEEKAPIDFHSPRTAEKPGPVEQDSCCSPGPVEEEGCCGPAPSPQPGGKKEKDSWKGYIPTALSLLMLGGGLILDYQEASAFSGIVRLLYYTIAYLLVGIPVLKMAWKNILKGEVFNEFFLMSIATLGAFYLGEYAEGVAVILFYVIGEHVQEMAVARSRRSIRNLIDQRPATVELKRGGDWKVSEAAFALPGDLVRLKAGERVALDGVLTGPAASFNTAALTGEPVPQVKQKGESVLAGMINLEKVTEMKVTSLYSESTMAKLMHLIEKASKQKAPTQRFITRFAKVYTPVVVFLALAITFLPAIWVENYLFETWLYRALVFLVISCPCALVVSIPLGYFGGIGAASRNGILFKGSDYLDKLAKADTVALDKTGTLTHGNFSVQQVKTEAAAPDNFLHLVGALESYSTHPIARAILEYTGKVPPLEMKNVQETAGLGIYGEINGMKVAAGSTRLLKQLNVAYDPKLDRIPETIVTVAINGVYAGYLLIADEVKEDAAEIVQQLKDQGVEHIAMLSGDKPAVVEALAKRLNIPEAYGGLLPQDKLLQVEKWIKEGRTVAFAGDGLNDAPVITRADIGIAMGALGSDAAIETADVVIQTDQPSKIAKAIKIGKQTKHIVWQNIALAFGVKLLILALGAGGIASLWEAVFADVGVALLAILNAVRLQFKRF